MIDGTDTIDSPADALKGVCWELSVGYCLLNLGISSLLVAFDIVPALFDRTFPVDPALLTRVLGFDSPFQPIREYALVLPGVAVDTALAPVVGQLVGGVDVWVHAASVLVLTGLGATMIVAALLRVVAALMLLVVAILESERAERRATEENQRVVRERSR